MCEFNFISFECNEEVLEMSGDAFNFYNFLRHITPTCKFVITASLVRVSDEMEQTYTLKIHNVLFH